MKPHSGVIYTYGDTIYNPSGIEIPLHLMSHEEVHSKQQGSDPDVWWTRYIGDAFFRIEQEVEAYAKQYDFICRKVKDRNARTRILVQMGDSLSSPTYGSVIGSQDARIMIKNKSNTK